MQKVVIVHIVHIWHMWTYVKITFVPEGLK